MSKDDKTLQQTVAEAIGETSETQTAEATETDGGLSQETAGETQSGETPDYVAGIDVSDIPVEDRPRFKEKLAQKAKLLEKGYQGKFTEVAELKKAQEELRRAGLTVAEANDVLTKHLASKANPQQAVTQTAKQLKTLDKLIDNSPLEQRPALEQMRQIILEEAGVGDVRKELEELRAYVKDARSTADLVKTDKANSYIDNLTSKYGEDLVSKYRQEMVNAHIKYNIPLEKLAGGVIPLEELEQAILTKGKKPLTSEKKKAISPQSSTLSSAEKVDVKATSMVDLIKRGLIGK